MSATEVDGGEDFLALVVPVEGVFGLVAVEIIFAVGYDFGKGYG